MNLLLKMTEEEQILATTNLNNTCIYENKLILPLVYMIKKFTTNHENFLFAGGGGRENFIVMGEGAKILAHLNSNS